MSECSSPDPVSRVQNNQTARDRVSLSPLLIQPGYLCVFLTNEIQNTAARTPKQSHFKFPCLHSRRRRSIASASELNIARSVKICA